MDELDTQMGAARKGTITPQMEVKIGRAHV